MRYHITTFGCQMNTSDAERIAAVLDGMGMAEATEFELADLHVVVTCSVRQSAENRARSVLERVGALKRKRPGIVCVLTGCMATKRGFREAPEVVRGRLRRAFPMTDILLDIRDLPGLPHMLSPFLPEVKIPASDNLVQSAFDIAPRLRERHTAYVPISTGCNNFCTYCIVPYTRGREVSRPVQSILDECRRHIDAGVKNIVLLGQNVDSYGKDIGVRFPRLLELVCDCAGDFWVHFLSSNPQDMGVDVIAAVRDLPKLQPFIHLPLQSGSDEILRRMGRKYTRAAYDALYRRIRESIPDVAVSTDIIVGFPGETREHFEQTADAFRALEFNMAYLNRYSPRPPAPSAKMRDNVLECEKKRRERVLNELLKRSALKRNEALVGRTVRCLILERAPDGEDCAFGITPQRTPVTVASVPESAIGTFVNVTISDASPWRVRGMMKA